MGSKDPRIRAKQRQISLITFEKQKSKLMGSRDPRIQAKQRQISVTTFEKQKSKLMGSMDPRILGNQRQILWQPLKNKNLNIGIQGSRDPS